MMKLVFELMMWIKCMKLESQYDSNDCGIACLSMLINSYGFDFNESEYRNMYTSLNGIKIKTILEILKDHQFDCKAVKIKAEDIENDFSLPAIAIIKSDCVLKHYVVIYKIRHKHIYIADPAKGKYKLNYSDFGKVFDEILILAVPMISGKKVRKSMSSLLEFFKELIFPQKKMILMIFIASCLLTILGIISGAFSKILIDEIIPFNLTRKLFLLALFFGLLSIIQSILNAFRQHILLFLERKIDIPVSLGYFDHILNLPMSFFGSKRIGDILTRYQDSTTIKNIVLGLSITLVLDILLALGSGLVLFHISQKLFIILLVQLIINVILIYLFKSPYKKLNYDMMTLNSDLNAYLIESFQNVELVKSYSCESNTIRNVENKLIRLLKRKYEGGILQNIQTIIGSICDGILPLILYVVAATLIMDKEMTLGDLIFFQTLSTYFLNPVQSLATLQLTFQEANISIKRLNELMDISREDHHSGIKEIGNGDIEFKNIDFHYKNGKQILKNVNLIIKEGEKIGIIGKSGCGKTTLIKLLLKFETASSGNIVINGYNIDDIDLKCLRNKIRYVSQNVHLFSGTLYENITYGSNENNASKIKEICKICGLDEMIDHMPMRMNTYIEENGINLSLGEKQRISIARSLLKGGDIYIFDECTSNLDEVNENLFKNIINYYLYEKTVIIVSHKYSTIECCSKIFKIVDGDLFQDSSQKDSARQESGDYLVYE